MPDPLTNAAKEPGQPGVSKPKHTIQDALDKFSSLKKLFSSDSAAPCLLHSDDPSVKIFKRSKGSASFFEKEEPKNIPEEIACLREGEFVWETIYKPSTSPMQINARQEIIRLFSELKDFKEVRSLKEESYKLTDGIDSLFTLLPVSDYSQETALSVYQRWLHDRDYPCGSEAAGIVEKGFRHIKEGKAALKLLSQRFKQEVGPLAALGDEVAKISKAAKGFKRKYFLSDDFHSSKVQSVRTKALEKLTQLGSLIEIANFARSKEDFCHCDFDPEQEPHYEGGYSIVCPETKNHRNPSPASTKATIYSGDNMSGKSETGLKQPFYIQLLAQSFGYTTAKSGNFHIYDSFFYVDRASSDHDRDLSAYGKAVKTHMDVLSKLGKKAFGCLDEPYSETSPEGQTRMITGHVAHLVEDLGARVIVATHNEDFLKKTQSNSDYGMYHFRTEVDEAGKAVYLYELAEGIGNSNSIQVARGLEIDSLQVNEELIQGAEEYLSGLVEELPVVPLVWPSLKVYTETQREELKQGRDGATLLIPPPSRDHWQSKKKSTVLPAFTAFSGDKQLARDLPLGGFGMFANPSFRLGGWTYASGGSRNFISSMVLDSPPPCSEELHERQRTIAELIADDRYEELVGVETDLAVTLKYVSWIESCCGKLLNFNDHLSPFELFGSGNLGPGQREYLRHFLRLNQKLLGEKYHLEEVQEQYETYIDADKAIQNFYDQQPLSQYKECVDQLLERELPEGMQKAYNKLLKLLGKKNKIPNKAVSHRTAYKLIDASRKVQDLDYNDPRYKAWRKLSNYLMSTSPRPVDLHELQARFNSFSELFPEQEFDCASMSLETLRSFKDLVSEKRKLKKRSLWDAMEGKEDDYSEFQSFVHRLMEDMHLGQSKIDIPEPNLRAVVEGLHAAWDVSEQNKAPTMNNMRDTSHSFFTRLQKECEKLPGICAFDCDLSKVQQELDAICAYIRKKEEGSDLEYYNQWPDHLRVAMALQVATQEGNPYGDFLAILRSYDSVHMQQIANAIEAGLEEYGSLTSPNRRVFFEEEDFVRPRTWEKKKEHLELLIGAKKVKEIDQALEQDDDGPLKELIESLRIRDPRQVFHIINKIYDKKIAAADKGIKDLEAKYEKLKADYPWISSWGMDETEKLLRTPRASDLRELYQINERYERYAGPDEPRANVPEYTEDNLEERRTALYEFYETTIRNSPLFRRVEESIAAKEALNRQTEVFCKAHGLRFRFEASDTDRRRAFLRIGDAKEALNDHFYRTVVKLMTMKSCNYPSRDNHLYHHIKGAMSLAFLGHYFKENQCEPVEFNETGVVNFEDLYSLFESSDQVRHTVHIDETGRVFIINGPNMSGKTCLIKGLDVGVPLGRMLGFTTAKKASLPLFAGVVHFDRVTAKEDTRLSAAGNELILLTKGLNLAEANGPMFFTTDETGSTMSPRYQAAFLHSLVRLLHKQGHYVVCSSHHHEVISQLDRLSDQTGVYYLEYEIDKTGEIHYRYKLTQGFAPSEEIATARKLGMTEKILKRAEAA